MRAADLKKVKGSTAAIKSEKRHYCIDCKKKKMARYMRMVGISINGRNMYKCLDCKDENRCYGQNRHRN